MKYISLFSGIEAASVAWEPLGWKPIAFSEIEKFPCELLDKRFPNVPNLGDITKIDWTEYEGKVDLIVGGSPCQSFSYAGKREGLSGESGLMFEYIRAVRSVRPRYFIWENVPGAFSSEKGEAFRQFLTEMDECGYGMAWRVLDAQFFGVPQRRRRVFVVGCFGDTKRAAEILFKSESMCWDFASSRKKREDIASNPEDGSRKGCIPINGMIATRGKKLGDRTGFGIGESGDPAFTISTSHPYAVAYPVSGNIIGRLDKNGGHQFGVGSNYDPMFTLDTFGGHAIVASTESSTEGTLFTKDYNGIDDKSVNNNLLSVDSIVRKLTPLECERLQGFPDGWTDIYDETSDTPRYKALGNSMAVPVMRWIGERIHEVENVV